MGQNSGDRHGMQSGRGTMLLSSHVDEDGSGMHGVGGSGSHGGTIMVSVLVMVAGGSNVSVAVKVTVYRPSCPGSAV